jgi:hypothetical protein
VLLDETFQEERGLRAALDVMRMVKAMETRWQAQERRAFTVGIGVNSGKIVAGDTGFQQRREFAVIGNPADVAVRLEAASEELNATIVASQATYDPVREIFVGVPASSLPLRGLRRLQNAYVVRGVRKSAKDDRLTLPSQNAFKRTVVEPEEEAGRSDGATTPANAIDERVKNSVIFERPSFKGVDPPGVSARFSSLDDAEPALPEPPIVETYEDDQGPPIQLPP